MAEDTGGRLTPASGATPFVKGDVQAKDLKIECKTTTGESYSVKRKDLDELRDAAFREGGGEYVMQIEFHRGPGFNQRFAVIDWQTYLDLRRQAAELADLQAQRG